MSVSENLLLVKKEIDDAAAKCARSGKVKLLAVSKFHDAASVIEAARAGQLLFGENRVQEAAAKFEEVRRAAPDVELHIIGTLQRNKVRQAVKIASYIQSVDRLELLDEIEKEAARISKRIDVLLEFHTGEESKAGFVSVEQVREVLSRFARGDFHFTTVRGFMTMAPFTDDEAVVRAAFKTLRELRDNMQAEFAELDLSELSMGMSGDFKIAIEEGSTIVRVGTAIFGERA